MQLEIAVLSRPGGRESNQDACGFWSGNDVCFCVVADGAGGHAGGDVASKLVVQEALSWFRETQEEFGGGAIEAALRRANETVVRGQRANPAVGDMRATGVVLAVDFARELASWGHLGDSRLYCFRERRIVAQTRDHSVVQSLVDAGMLEPSQLRSSPDRSKLLAALGDLDGFHPRIARELFALYDGDKFLLCTDGLWEYIDEAEFESTLEDASCAEDWLRLLEARVIARGSATQDNYSALAVWCKAES